MKEVEEIDMKENERKKNWKWKDQENKFECWMGIERGRERAKEGKEVKIWTQGKVKVMEKS